VKGLIDTHCHLTDPAFEQDLGQVIERAMAAGIEKIIIPSVNLETSRRAVELANKFPQLFAAIGVHPEECDSFSDQEAAQLEDLAREKKVVAIGEIGLDFHYPPFDESLQQLVLERMLSLAASVKKPVLLHSRDAMGILLERLNVWKQELSAKGTLELNEAPGILHAFEGTPAQAQEAIALDFALGLGGPITYKNSIVKKQIAANTPLDHLVLETDSPYLPPHPYRGQRNEPAHILEIAEKVSQIKQRSVEEIALQTGKTGSRILKLGD
jgi:TatD DNase family protein